MSCCFKEVAKARIAAPDPAKHMNYSQGMVLGVEDFTQEFAYLSGRDQWIARDLIGYGTARGLAVSWDAATTRLTVTAGVAVTPCGQLVCVRENQCADMNKWLAENGAAVTEKIGAAVAGKITLHVVLSYQDCPTDSVPIPGEPCRSEDELKKPSRLADDFLLELSFDAPAQKEEDALREFMAWLRAISTTAAASTNIADFRKAIQAWKPGAAASAVVVKASDVDAYLREAFRIWVTELRPASYGRTCGCAPPKDEKDTGDKLLIATLEFGVELPVGQSWRVVALDKQDETKRPLLLHMRALQARLQATAAAAAGAGPAPPNPAPPMPAPRSAADATAAPECRVVAAGTVRGDNAGGSPVFGGLHVVKREFGKVTFSFTGYRPPNRKSQYIVKALPVSRPVQVTFLEFATDGFALQITQGGNRVKVDVLDDLELMLEVSAFAGQA